MYLEADFVSFHIFHFFVYDCGDGIPVLVAPPCVLLLFSKFAIDCDASVTFNA